MYGWSRTPPPSEVAATADEKGALAWTPASGEEMVEVGALWGEGREEETAGGLGDGGRRMGRGDGPREGTREHQRSTGIWAKLRAWGVVGYGPNVEGEERDGQDSG